MKPKRWQDWVNVILGVWMVISPWVLGFEASQAAARTAWILGAAVIVFAAIGIYMHEAWEETINIVLGICLAGSPWAFGFAEHTTAATNAVIVGVLVIAFGIWAMLRELDLKKVRDEHREAPGTR
jgi:hypothetical protein